ncbi:MAG: ABC transporter permease [Longimicrobiales bacterium]
MDSLGHSFRYTVRKLLRAPVFTAVAVLTLGVGIGSNAAIFSVIHAVLLEPLPFEDPDRLVGVWHTAPGLGFDEVNQSPALHFYYVEHSRTFESVGMWDNGSATVTGVGDPEQVATMSVTHQTLPILGIQPFMGRTFTPDEDSPEGPRTALLGYGYWQRRMGGDADVIGRTLVVNGVSREIIGVLPAELDFLGTDADLVLPFRFDPANVFVGNFSYQALARLADGATVEQANAEVARMVPEAVDAYPGGVTRGILEQARFGPLVRPLKEDVVGDVGQILWILLGTVSIVLLIACANVANLFLVRAEGQQREMAVRTAMGAGRGQLTGQLLLESLTLGLAGGVLGLVLAFVGLKLLVALGPESLPRLREIGIDPVVLAFTLVLSVVAGGLFGSFPALRFGRSDLVGALKEGGRGGSAGKERNLARNGLVVAQMALALVLLAGSGLMIRSFQALRSVDPGYSNPEAVLSFRVAIPEAEIEETLLLAQAHQQILRNLEATPGVAAAGMSSSVIMDGWDSNDALETESNPVVGDQIPPIRRYKFIAPGYFATVGNPMVAGRDLTWGDIQDRARVVVVSAALARAEWGDPAAAIGQRVRQAMGGEGGPWYEVVGVSGDERDDGVGRDPVPIVFWPQVTEDFYGNEGPHTQRSMAFVVRAADGDPARLLPAIREAVWAVDPNLPLARVYTLEEFAARSMAQTSFTLVMLGIAAGVALFLGVVGIYGVISYVVSQRTREIGVRMAIGAERADVRRMVLRQALTLALLGVGVGLIAAAGLTRLMASLLYGVGPMDPVTFGGVAVALSTVALVASWIPARRAAGVNPVEALRAEA